MSSLILFLVLLFSSMGLLVFQHFLPSIEWMHGSRVQLIPVFLAYGALVLDYWWVLGLVFVTGFFWDAVQVQVLGTALDPTVELPLGWSILFFWAACSIIHGFRPLFLKGRWEVHAILSGLFVSTQILAEYLLISLHRTGWEMSDVVWWRVIAPGVIATLVAAPVCLVLQYLARIVNHPLYLQPSSLK